ncbi:MAG: PfkB family carbohydrate kinase, partial [Deltaproteobacteria bacterium]|nr:PfkB family carbohydrate kinase [Deltaproteobacteria bacterium]
DPGQSLPMLAARDLVQSLEGCRILIANDYELDLILGKTGMNKEALLKRAAAVIVTLGELGSRLFTPGCEICIPAAKPKTVKDPTGAGDSYRGGLISGLVQGMAIEQCARMGSVCASFAVECVGTQEYRFSFEEFNGGRRALWDGPPCTEPLSASLPIPIPGILQTPFGPFLPRILAFCPRV